MSVDILPPSEACPDGGALALLRLPAVFTQDDLMRSEDFLKEAKRRGHDLTIQNLEVLHSTRLLLPLYRIAETAVAGRAFDVEGPFRLNPRGWVMEAAASGCLRDCADEGYSTAWPYERPEAESDHRWWNRFVYSSWQLLDVGDALRDLAWVENGGDSPHFVRRAAARRQRTLALAALATRHLPSFVGRIRYPSGIDHESLRASRYDIDEKPRLDIVAYSADRLRDEAEQLLVAAHWDPLIEWWPVIRHSNADGWAKINGPSADFLWMRIAAEVLLRAHEELAEDGIVESLPDLGAMRSWHPLADRIHRLDARAESLDEALADFGLLPHPRVVLLVEGQTEELLFHRILDLFGLDHPRYVRVVNVRGADVKVGLIARYAGAPRLGRRYADSKILEVRPTAVVIAMDPEGQWSTEQGREKAVLALKNGLREEVEAQGGVIGQDELDFLVTLHVWDGQSFELANFTDDELGACLAGLGAEQGLGTGGTWTASAVTEVAKARADRKDVSRAMDALGVRQNKPRLAELLWPTLREKFEHALGEADSQLPVLAVIQDVRNKVGLLSGGAYTLSTS